MDADSLINALTIAAVIALNALPVALLVIAHLMRELRKARTDAATAKRRLADVEALRRSHE